MSINLETFKDKFNYFKRTDFDGFGGFWRWKLQTETKKEHILDAIHVEETFYRLSPILKEWQWHRPERFVPLAGRLKTAFEKIYDAYNLIRGYSLLEFNKIPEEPLKLIWHALGTVKGYSIMAITKPLMILWGQTLAFDSKVREYMPRFGIAGLSEISWRFTQWKKVMGQFQERLKQQSEVLYFFQEVARKEYGPTSIIPYGQFLDLYYWVECQ